jgi:hypothetical protein
VPSRAGSGTVFLIDEDVQVLGQRKRELPPLVAAGNDGMAQVAVANVVDELLPGADEAASGFGAAV